MIIVYERSPQWKEKCVILDQMVKMSKTVSRGSHILNYYEDCDKITTLSDDFMTIYDW